MTDSDYRRLTDYEKGRKDGCEIGYNNGFAVGKNRGRMETFGSVKDFVMTALEDENDNNNNSLINPTKEKED